MVGFFFRSPLALLWLLPIPTPTLAPQKQQQKLISKTILLRFSTSINRTQGLKQTTQGEAFAHFLI